LDDAVSAAANTVCRTNPRQWNLSYHSSTGRRFTNSCSNSCSPTMLRPSLAHIYSRQRRAPSPGKKAEIPAVRPPELLFCLDRRTAGYRPRFDARLNRGTAGAARSINCELRGRSTSDVPRRCRAARQHLPIVAQHDVNRRNHKYGEERRRHEPKQQRNRQPLEDRIE
jgi:hypothetical protein